MTELSFADAVRAGGFVLLGELFPDYPSAQGLLDDVGISMARLPAFGTPEVGRWWWQVGRRIEQGHFPNVGQRELFAAALAYAPDNALLRRLLGESGPTSVLFLLANPEERGRNRLDVEVREVQAVRREYPEQLEIRVSHATRIQDLVRELADGKLDILHFAGHGTADGRLILDGPGGGEPVESAHFAGLVVAAGHPRCVVFSSCFNGGYLPLLRGSATHVIGSAEPISDKCAVFFSAAFYRRLAAGRPVPDAHAFADAAMTVQGCESRMRIWG
jgi:CHAT domain/Effector-associated domain 1